MKTLPTWKRPERWLAFVLTFFGVCAFLAIVPATGEQAPSAEDAAAASEAMAAGNFTFMDYLRQGAEEVRVRGHWTALLPPLVAIMVAAFFRALIGALFSAFMVGAFLSYGLNPLAAATLGIYEFLLKPTFSQISAFIILFLFALVGMTHVMAASGGLGGLVRKLGGFARDRRRAKISIGLGGLLIFFDDYANTVVLGTTMQRLSDRWRISREKLAYLVDSTTAPVAGLALLSTWVVYEAQILGKATVESGLETSGYSLLVEMLPLRFYCIGTLAFLFLNAAIGRDFGPMLRAERRAFREGKVVDDAHEKLGIQPSDTLEPVERSSERWYNAVAPIGALMTCIVVGIMVVGSLRMSASGDTFSWTSLADWRAAFAATVFNPSGEEGAGAMPVLLFAAAVGGVVAVWMPVRQGAMSFRTAMKAYARGLPTMWMAIFILVMTWSMQAICENLGTAQYLIALLGEGMPLWMLPLLSFFLAAGMAFATGSSWGAMGVLIPILLPLAVEMGALETASYTIFLLTAAAVLDGAIFGDHCSPISDSTVLSSISTGCDHIAHVNTQLYYALAVVAVACVFGYVAVAQGMPIWGFYFLAPLSFIALLRLVGQRP